MVEMMVDYANSGAGSTSSSITTKDVTKITDKLFKVFFPTILAAKSYLSLYMSLK